MTFLPDEWWAYAPLGGMLLVTLVVVVTFHCILGTAFKTVVQQLDRRYLGVDVHIGGMTANVCTLKAMVKHVVVDNPPGYESPHLISVNRVVVNCSMRRMLGSCGRRMLIQELELDRVKVNVEKKGFSTSNLGEVQHILNQQQKELNDEEVGYSSSGSDDGAALRKKKAPSDKDTSVEVRKVTIHDVKVVFSAWKFNLTVQAADFTSADFSGDSEGRELEFVINYVLRSLLSTVMANLPMAAANQALSQVPSWLGGGRGGGGGDHGRRGSGSSSSSASSGSWSGSDSDASEEIGPSCCLMRK